MSYRIIPDKPSKVCSACKSQLHEAAFFRKGRSWKTCNVCSNVQTRKRHAETLQASGGYETVMYGEVEQRLVVLGTNLQEYNELMAQQQAFEQQQQYHLEQYWQLSQGAQMSLDYLLDDTAVVEIFPSELYEEYSIAELPVAGHSNIEPRPEGEYCASMTDMDCENLTEQCIAEFGFGEDGLEAHERTNSLISGAPDQVSSLSQYGAETPDMMDVEMECMDNLAADETYQVQPAAAIKANVQVPVKHVPQKLTLHSFFADFNPSDDLLRQPSPKHDLTGEALMKHHISKLGLAIRLSALTCHWHNMKHNIWYKEVNNLDRLEESGKITAWGPLSDWLVLFQNGLEDILEAYPLGTELNYQVAYKVRGRKAGLLKSLREQLRAEAERLFQEHKDALFNFFLELTGQPEQQVKYALDKEAQLMRRAIKQDCAINGIWST